MQSRQGLVLEITRIHLAGKNNHLEIYNCKFSSFQTQTSCIPLQVSCTSNTPTDFGLLLQNSHTTMGVTLQYFEVLYIHAENLLHLDSDILSLHDYTRVGIEQPGAAGNCPVHWCSTKPASNSWVTSPCSVLGENNSKRGCGVQHTPRKDKTHCRLLCSAGGKLKKWKVSIRAPTEMNGKAPGDIRDAHLGKKKLT